MTGRFPRAMAAETLWIYQIGFELTVHTTRVLCVGCVLFPTVYREPQSGRKHSCFPTCQPYNMHVSGDYQDIGLLVPVSSDSLSSCLPHPAYQPSRLAGSLSPEGMEISSRGRLPA